MIKTKEKSRIVVSEEIIKLAEDEEIVQVECVGMTLLYEIAKKEEEEKSSKENNALIFATGKLSAMTTLIGRLKAECSNPNRDWLGNKTYKEILNYILHLIKRKYNKNCSTITQAKV